MKNEREIVEEKEETAGNPPSKRKRLTEVFKSPKPSPAKTDSCNPFHKRTQDRTKERENVPFLDLGISKDREWAAKAPRVGLLNTHCAGKRPRTGWSTRLSILKKNSPCYRAQRTLDCHLAPRVCLFLTRPEIAHSGYNVIATNLHM